ncbi:MAG: THUMP domain-containing protein [Rhodothermales bacterium]
MYKYQEFGRYFAQIAGGTEELGAEELEALGAINTATAYRGLYFDADPEVLYRINYCSRLVTRVLAPLTSFGCHDEDYLYRTAMEVDWSDFLNVDQTFAVFANVTHSKISHSKYAALRLKDAIVDQFRERTGKRPSVDTRDPHVWFNLYIENDHATISAGTSGGSLHRRGYRERSVEAPMQETVAAAIIRLSGWEGERPLHDPMCGSGTLLAEALMAYCRVPAAYLRDGFGFEALPDFDAARWERVKAEADGKIRELPPDLISGSDVDSAAVESARINLRHLPFGDRVALSTCDFRDLGPRHDVTLVMNPPYGVRMDGGGRIESLYRDIGDYLKQECTGSTAYIYVGKPELLKSVGLRTSFKRPLVNGAMEGRLAKYEMY